MSAVSLPMLEDRRSYVYAHAKATTGEIFYIGKGIGRRAHDIKSRSAWHKRVSERHGVDVHVLERHLTASEAYAREVVLIAEGREIGLDLVNMNAGGEGGINPTEEVRARMSASKTGVLRGPYSPEHRAKIATSNTGKVHSAETRSKLSSAHTSARRAAQSLLFKGKPLKPETRAKLSAANVGKSHSAETRAKMSASHSAPDKRAAQSERMKNRAPASAETRAKLSLANKGKKLSAEHRAKIAASHAGKKYSAERCAQMSEITKAQHARKQLTQGDSHGR